MQDPAQEIAEIMSDGKEVVATESEETSQESKAEASQEQVSAKDDAVDDDELEIEGMEEEDGRIKYTFGNSVYVSKEGLSGNKAVSDVLRQAREAETAKDKAYLEMRAKTSQQKAATAITIPKTFDDDGEEKLPEIPKRQAIINHVFQNASLRPEMAGWTDDDWIKYEDENGLRAWQTQKLQNAVAQSVRESDNLESAYVRQYNNALALRQSRDSVRDMVAGIDGVDADDFSNEFHEILKRGMKGEGLNEFKELNPAWVVKEFGKVVGKTLTTRQKSKLETEVQKKVLESQEQRRKAKPTAGAPAAPFKKNVKTATSIAEAAKMIMESEGWGQ